MRTAAGLLAILTAVTQVSHAQGSGAMSIAACLSVDSIGSQARAFVVAPQCSRVWTDSLGSTVRTRADLARGALSMIGGRAAVAALHAQFKRSGHPLDRIATINAMATTGSPEDVDFLIEQLMVPDNGDSWPSIQAAATVLGLHRATTARESLGVVVARTSTGRFTNRAARAALEALDHPPCADSVVADLARELARIVMECTPPFLRKVSRYEDASTGNVWLYADSTWRARVRQATDTVSGTITTSVALLPGGEDAMVHMRMVCGGHCGEGWTYRLRRTGRVWRVIGAEFNWVS